MAVIAVELGWIIATGNPHDHGTHANASQVSPDENPWRWFISAAFWSTVFAGLLTVFNVGLWRQTRNLAGLTRESIDKAEASSAQQAMDMDASLGVAREANRIAASTLAASQDNVVKTRRAYVVMGGTQAVRIAGPLDPATGGKPIPISRFYFHWQNGGQTPAILVYFHTEKAWYASEERVVFPDFNSVPEKRVGVIGAGTTATAAHIDFTNEELAAIFRGERRCVMRLGVEYSDIFEPLVARRTQAVLQLHYGADPFVANRLHLDVLGRWDTVAPKLNFMT